MPTTNQQLFDRTIDHAVNLAHYASGVVRRMRALMNRADTKLWGELQAALERLDPAAFTVQRLDVLLQSVRSLNTQTIADMRVNLERELGNLVGYELEWQHRTLIEVLPARIVADVGITQVTPPQVAAAAMSQPFRGRLLKEWADSLSLQRMNRISDALRIGYVSGDTVDQMVRTLRGTRAQNYRDGLLQADYRNAEAIVRTAVGHTASYARQKFYESNEDLISELRWVSTLDNRTTELCMVRDGLHYTADEDHKPIGHKVPWAGGPGRLHWNCRSTSVPVVKGWKKLGIELPALERASMDGATPGDQTYAEWLAKQPASRQDEILGPTRGKLLRVGKLTVDRFSDDKGRWLTLDQLRIRESRAFTRAKV